MRFLFKAGAEIQRQSEYECAVRGINNLRDAYLSAGRSSGGIDRALFKLMNSKYKRAPVR